ncbi:MAG: SDR family oxidoreductase [Janthinobacterium lividum]
MSKILVTGATGGLGRAVVESLLPTTDAHQISVLARDPAKAADLQAQGVTVHQGDYNDYASLVRAFSGIDKVLLVSSNDLPNRTAQHANVLKAAQEAGVQHVVYTSAQRKTEDGSSAVTFVTEAHIATEKLLKASGLTYTILKNALYLDVLPQFMGPQVLETSTIYLPAGTGKGSFASRADMGAAGAAVLTGSGHENQTYEIAGNSSYSYADIAQLLSQLTGKTIHYVAASPNEFKEQLAQAGVPAEMAMFATAFSQGIAQGEFDLPDPTLAQLIGREPESAREFLKQAYQL